MDLIIMAAGLASRYGKKKQFEPVCGLKTIMDYSIEFAFRSGFKRVVLIISLDAESLINDRFHDLIVSGKLIYLIQMTGMLPQKYGSLSKDRIKPWGTGHILFLLSRENVSDSFCLINADDFYGEQAFKIAQHCADSFPHEHGLIAYRLGNTLSENGPVSRAVCDIQPGNHHCDKTYSLKEIRELQGIQKITGKITADNSDIELRENSPVSLNFWIFNKKILTDIEHRFEFFLSEYTPDNSLQREFQLPDYIRYQLGKNVPVYVKLNQDKYFGLTYAGDLQPLRQFIQNQ